MQKPFAYSPVNKDAPDSFFSRRQFPIIAFIAAIMALIISFPLINARYGGNDSAVHSGASTADELFSGIRSRSEPGTMGDQRRPISKPYILASLLIAIVIWATMGSPTVGARSGSNIRKSMLTPSTFPVARNNTDWR